MALITVSRHENPIEAEIFRSRLQAEGIPAFLGSEHHVRMDWLYSTALGGVRVQVPVVCAEQAIGIVRALRRGDYDIDVPADALHCPACGSHEIGEELESWRLAFLSLLVFALPLPFTRQRVRCRACGCRGDRQRFLWANEVEG